MNLTTFGISMRVEKREISSLVFQALKTNWLHVQNTYISLLRVIKYWLPSKYKYY